MTCAQQVLAQVVLAEFEAGRLELRGNQFIRNGQQVVPRLSFEPEVGTAAATSVPDPGARLPTDEQNKDFGMATQFADLPKPRLPARAQSARGCWAVAGHTRRADRGHLSAAGPVRIRGQLDQRVAAVRARDRARSGRRGVF